MLFYLKYIVLNEPLNNPTPTFKEPILVGIILVKISFKGANFDFYYLQSLFCRMQCFAIEP